MCSHGRVTVSFRATRSFAVIITAQGWFVHEGYEETYELSVGCMRPGVAVCIFLYIVRNRIMHYT